MNTPTPTPRTDAAVKLTFAAGHNTVCPNFARTLERELTALTAERDQLRDQLAAARHRETIALVSWDEERNRALREGARVVEWRDRAERAEAAETVALANWNGALERAMKAEAELATERARLDSGTILLIVAGERVWHCGVDLRAAIDAGMQEDAK